MYSLVREFPDLVCG